MLISKEILYFYLFIFVTKSYYFGFDTMPFMRKQR